MNRIYIDNDVVSGFRRRDLKPEELSAIDTLTALAVTGSISLFVSAVHDREAAPLPEQYRQEQQKILATFPAVEFAEDHRLLGFNMVYSGPGGTGGFITHPLIEDDTVARRLREIGLDRPDAHHVMLAIRRQCAVFVTCDERTILNHRGAVEVVFPIHLMLPSELLRDIQQRLQERAR